MIALKAFKHLHPGQMKAAQDYCRQAFFDLSSCKSEK